MRFVLSVFAALALVSGVLVSLLAQSAAHEILGACGMIVFAIAGGSAAIIEHQKRLIREAEKQTKLLEQLARGAGGGAGEKAAPPATPSYRIPGLDG
jgi:cytochrome c biogenesis factor